MNKKLRYSLLMLLMAVCGLSYADTWSITFNNELYGLESSDNKSTVDVTNLTYGNGDVTISFANTGSNAPKYYANGQALRTYSGNTWTFSAADGYKITELSMESSQGNFTKAMFSPDDENFTGNSSKAITWHGNSSTVTFGPTATIRVTKVTITYVSETPADGLAKPTFSVEAGTVAVGTSVELTQEDADAIFYTTDGTNPIFDFDSFESNGTEYSGAITITKNTTIKAIAVSLDDEAVSAVATAEYTIEVPAPTFSVAAGTVEEGTTVALSAEEGLTIVYTTDGTTPTPDLGGTEEIYTDPIELTESMTIKAIAVDDYDNASEVATAAYTVVAPFDNPVTYKKVTSLDDIKTNRKYIFVYEGNDGRGKAMADLVSGKKYRDGADVTIDSDAKTATTAAAGTVEFSLEESEETEGAYAVTDGTIYLKSNSSGTDLANTGGNTADYGYSIAESGSGYILKVKAANNGRAIRWSTSSVRFAHYTTSATQFDAYLYYIGDDEPVIEEEPDEAAFVPQDVNVDGYFFIKSSDGKMVEVVGRKTAGPTATEVTPGTVIKVKAEGGKVTELRSQACDPTQYIQKAMKYVPSVVNTMVEKLGLDGSGNLFGETGVDAILAELNEELDVNLYLEESNDGYRIFGRTPSMDAVKHFYADNKAKVDAKLPGLEAAINEALDKIVDRLGRGEQLRNSFKLSTIYDRMVAAGCDVPNPADDVMAFYHAVLAKRNNIWQFAYQTATFYMEIVENTSLFQSIDSDLLKTYWNKVKQIRPSFKYYIVADGEEFAIISEGNTKIKNNDPSTFWTLESAETFNKTLATSYDLDGTTYYYGTFNVDFAYTLPEGVKAYYASGIDSDNILQMDEITGTIPAQTPVLLESEGNAEIEIYPVSDDSEALSGNLLVGNDYFIDLYEIKSSEVVSFFNLFDALLNGTHLLDDYAHLQKKNSGTINNKFFFTVTKDELLDENGNEREEITNGALRAFGKSKKGSIGFYKYRGNLDGNKCYIYVADGAGINGIRFNDADATAIRSIDFNETMTNDAIYDLQGRKVLKATRGVYISNGKKVVVK